MMILKHCRLIPELCEGILEEVADIRIEGNTIAEILPAGGSYAGEEVIDCTGMTVLPGLFNLHVHLAFWGGTKEELLQKQTEFAHTARSIRYMNELLSYGFTSLRDVGTPYNIAIKLRDLINAGQLIGPDIKACGHMLTPDMVLGMPLDFHTHNFGQAANDPYLARGIARRQLADGADFLKIFGCSQAPNRRGGGPIFYPDELEELSNVARREGTYLAVHTNSEESNAVAIAMEPGTIEHGNFWTQKDSDQIAAHGFTTAVVPTLQIIGAYGEEACAMHTAGLRLAYDAGVLLGFGTDATEKMFLDEPQSEFVSRARIWGIPNVEILKQATINSARINGTDDLRGSIKVGKRADFAIVDGRPDEDLTVFGKPCTYVLKDGVVVARRGMVRC